MMYADCGAGLRRRDVNMRFGNRLPGGMWPTGFEKRPPAASLCKWWGHSIHQWSNEKLLPPAHFIAFFFQAARDGIGIWRFRFQRLERSSEQSND